VAKLRKTAELSCLTRGGQEDQGAQKEGHGTKWLSCTVARRNT
jgi:hypothetical protein